MDTGSARAIFGFMDGDRQNEDDPLAIPATTFFSYGGCSARIEVAACPARR
jgi:hypothetical protein